MERKQEKLLPIGEAFGDLAGLVKACKRSRPRRGATTAASIRWTPWCGPAKLTPNRASWRGGRCFARCPGQTPAAARSTSRRNGPYTLVMTAGHPHKLPFGNLPRLLAAWVCTEAVRTQSRVLVLGRSLSEFMRKLDIEAQSGGRGGVRTRLRNQMQRFFSAQIRVVYQDKYGERFISSAIADEGEFWWNERRPDDPVLFESKIELGEKFFEEIISHPVRWT